MSWARADGGRVRHPRRYALATLRGEAERVASAAPGHRNDALNYAAWRLWRLLDVADLIADAFAAGWLMTSIASAAS